MTADDVTFRYRDHRTQEVRRVTLTGIEFLQRFLQHVARAVVDVSKSLRMSGAWTIAGGRRLRIGELAIADSVIV